MTSKTIRPFITHGGYGVGNSEAVLAGGAGARRADRTAFVMEADQERRTMTQVNGWLDTVVRR